MDRESCYTALQLTALGNLAATNIVTKKERKKIRRGKKSTLLSQLRPTVKFRA
jgi:hypothetical protein